jgi:L-ascorbate metabolism protein UlaG (beta-lactamase superfamily)
VFHDVGAKWLVPMHYGSFKLSFEPIEEPPRLLVELAQEQNVDHHIQILDEGVPRLF